MAGEEPSSPTVSGGKHQRSPEEASREESTKRRKHHHRHRRSHRHGRHRKEEDEAEKPADEDVEEGEILDEGKELKEGSGAESGEVKLNGSDLDLNLIREAYAEPDNTDDKSSLLDKIKEMDLDQNGHETESKRDEIKPHKRKEDSHGDKKKRSVSPTKSQEKSPSHHKKHEDRQKGDKRREEKVDKYSHRSLKDENNDLRDLIDSHDTRDRRHGSRERVRGEREHRDRASERHTSVRGRDDERESRGMERERERSSSVRRRDDERESRGRERERERSSSVRRRDDERRERESMDRRHGEREKRGRERERERERSSSVRGRVDERRERERYNRERESRGRDNERRDRYRDNYRDERERNNQGRERNYKEETKGNKPIKEEEEEEEDYEEKIEQQLSQQDEEERIKEESRRRRQAILEKYSKQQPQDINTNKEEEAPKKDEVEISNGEMKSPIFEDNNDEDLSDADKAFTLDKSPAQQNGVMPNEKAPGGAPGLGEGTPKSEKLEADMFCDDIFGETPVKVNKVGKEDKMQIERSGLHDNWDDAEGYYSYRFGEVLDGRYEIIAAQGKGVFSTVVRAKDLKAGKNGPEEVAIKIIRNNETMYKAGMEELVILKKLAGADPEDRRHCVRFISSFKYRNHLCLVFESLYMNLREVLKKFGRNIGLKLTAVRAYAKQLFISLKHLRNCGVLHCDIKPDNMLVNEAKNVLKLCDFGNAMFAGQNEITPYLVSRFYRAPEIILGLPYDHPLDIWSVGCCLYELYTGKVLFPGPSNNDMLRLHMELKGPFPKKMLKKAAFVDRHFDPDLNFHASEEDPVTKKTIKRLMVNIKPKDIGNLMSSSPGEDAKLVANFKDILERIFVLDPDKRITVSQALSHPFITVVLLLPLML